MSRSKAIQLVATAQNHATQECEKHPNACHIRQLIKEVRPSISHISEDKRSRYRDQQKSKRKREVKLFNANLRTFFECIRPCSQQDHCPKHERIRGSIA